MNKEGTKGEFEAFKEVYEALEPLDDETRSRVAKSVITLLAIDAHVKSEIEEDEIADEAAEQAANEAAKGAQTFSTFADLYAAADPTTQSEGALVAGYWLQVCQGDENFVSQAVNKELTHLGHKVGNITAAINGLKEAKPQLMLQIKKGGSSKQARKIYKLSDAGIKRVQEMING